MAQLKGPVFRTGDYLHQGDYLVSANGWFCAFLHDDGNLCIYRSPSPDAKTNIWCSGKPVSQGPKSAYLHDDGNLCIYNREWPDVKTNIWCSGKPVSQGPKSACLHDDGNLCIYNSEWPDAKTNTWCSGPTDPVVDFEISSIDYYLKSARIVQTGPAELYRQSVKNTTSQPQSSSINGKESVSETRGWSDSLAVKVGASTSFKCGYPCLAEGKITVSAEVSNTFTWNGSVTRSKEWGFNTPVTVNPYRTIVALVSVIPSRGINLDFLLTKV